MQEAEAPSQDDLEAEAASAVDDVEEEASADEEEPVAKAPSSQVGEPKLAPLPAYVYIPHDGTDKLTT